MSTDSGEELAVLEPTAFLRALKRVVVRLLALQEALQGQIIKDDTLRRNFASAVLRLYEHEEALLVSLLHNAINQAIRLPETESLMLREGSLMVDFLSEFAKQATIPQRVRMQPLVQKMVKDNAPMEVDPARLGLTLTPDGEVPPALRQARENLLQCATSFLNTIIASVEAAPRAFKKVIRIVFESAEARFPGSGYRTLGGVIFLRLFCPAIVAPEASQLTSSTVPPAVRRSLILVAKLLQSLVNESTLEKEEYMLCFNPWIKENVATIHMAFLSWVGQGASKRQQQGDAESGEASPQSSPRQGQNEQSAEWRLSSSSISSSSSSDACEPPSFTESLDEASVQVIEEGLKESMAVLQAYQEDMAVMVAIRRLDARYREVQYSLRALFAASHPDSAAAVAALQHDIGSAPNGTMSSGPYNRFSMSSPTVLTRVSRHRSMSAEQLSNSDDVELAKPKLGSFIGRFSGRARSSSKSSGGGGKDASLDVVRWDRKQVCAWLQTLGLEEDVVKDYDRAFKKQNVTGLRLQQITRETLNDLGIKRLGDRKKILAQAQELYRERLASLLVKDMEDWSVEDVVAWLGTNELTEYQELWLKDQVDGQMLLEAVQLDNVQRLSVTKCGHRKRLVRLVRERGASTA